MKKFDISNLIVYKIQDVYSYTLPARTEGEAQLSHNVLLYRRSGCSEYEVGKKKYTLDSDNMLFLPAGTKYSMFVREAGECAIIEFDTADGCVCDICEFFTEGDKEIASTAKIFCTIGSSKVRHTIPNACPSSIPCLRDFPQYGRLHIRLQANTE